MTIEEYDNMIGELFVRFPSFQSVGSSAYKPGIDSMIIFDGMLGHPHRSYRTVHIAGTNGKGSVSSMLASALAATGLKVGLFTSPHLLDFRERIKIISGSPSGNGNSRVGGSPLGNGNSRVGGSPSGNGYCPAPEMIPRTEVYAFVQRWKEVFDHLDLSFFEITTMMALDWFATRKVDIAVIETGLGGRLDSTNIILPELSVITNIGLDHCSMLGDTLPEIAFEKAGIIKPRVPVVVGESHPETDEVFRRKVLYTNLPEAEYMGDRDKIMSLLTFADKAEPTLWQFRDDILQRMDLQGPCQSHNLRTVAAALDVLFPSLATDAETSVPISRQGDNPVPISRQGGILGPVIEGVVCAAGRTGLRGRWETLSQSPRVIADIGHNSHGLRYNFSRLEQMMEGGGYEDLIIIYGSMADKDVDRIMAMLPRCARMVFVTAPGKRAMPAGDIMRKYLEAGGDASRAKTYESVGEALDEVLAGASSRSLVYIGGSAYLVAASLPRFAPGQD